MGIAESIVIVLILILVYIFVVSPSKGAAVVAKLKTLFGTAPPNTPLNTPLNTYTPKIPPGAHVPGSPPPIFFEPSLTSAFRGPDALRWGTNTTNFYPCVGVDGDQIAGQVAAQGEETCMVSRGGNAYRIPGRTLVDDGKYLWIPGDDVGRPSVPQGYVVVGTDRSSSINDRSARQFLCRGTVPGLSPDWIVPGHVIETDKSTCLIPWNGSVQPAGRGWELASHA